jgi:hypothetical protein
LVTEVENEKENLDVKRTRFQTILIFIGLSCLILGVVLLISTVFMEIDSFEFFVATLVSGLLFGFALFFEGHGYYLLPKEYQESPAYFGSPVLYQIVRVIYRIPYVLLCYNGFIFIGEVNFDFIVILVIFYFPYIISRASWRWTRLRQWLRSLDTA